MNGKDMLTGIFSLLGLLFLILFRDCAIEGAAQGLKLCIESVIPGLFPFFLLTGLLMSSLQNVRIPLLHSAAKVLGMPAGTEALLIPGILGGYPLGAKSVGDLYRRGALSKAAALHLLLFCSNAGPAFFFGFLPAQFPQISTVFVLWGIHLLSAFLTGLTFPAGEAAAVTIRTQSPSLSESMASSLRATALVCGWILCFRMLSTGLTELILWRLPCWIRILFTGLLELTNGCSLLGELSSWEDRFLLVSPLLALGGLCVTMQTSAVLEDLPIRTYLLGKLLQAFYSLILSLSYIRHIWSPAILMVTAILLLRIAVKKRSGKIPAVGV